MGPMENGIYLGLSRQMVLRSVMETTAHNVANMSTPGFRAQKPVFAAALASVGGGQQASFAAQGGAYKPNTPGALRATGSPLHAAIVGPGFFGATAPDGRQAYTRAGDFQRAADGTLLTAGGAPVSAPGGGAVTIPDDAQNLSIDGAGVISDADGPIARLMLVEFADPDAMRPIGAGLYVTDEAPADATESRVAGGMVEGSNVEPIGEMTAMVDVLRSYQSVQDVLSKENERILQAIERLTRTS
jgi:flagellar basal-body rod protein FlgF